MEVRFSDQWVRDNPRIYPETAISKVAIANDHWVAIKWADDSACRFVILERPGDAQLADYAAHDKVIRALLAIDPHAEIRTAKAIYRGLADFDNQQKVTHAR